MYSVRFSDLGRYKLVFEVKTIYYPNYNFMYAQVKRYLQSRELYFKEGIVYAGFRPVGKYTIIDESLQE